MPAVVGVQHFSHWLPRVNASEEVFTSRLAMRRLWEHNRQALAGEDAEEALSGGVGPKVCRVQDAMGEIIPTATDIAHPAEVKTASIFADGLAVLIEVAPHHKLADVFNLDIIGLEGINVAEKVLGECPTVRIAGLATFGPAEVGTFQGGPQHQERAGVLCPLSGRVLHKSGQVQRADIFCVVLGLRVIGKVGSDGVRVVIHAGDDMGALLAVQRRRFNARRCSSSTTKQVYVKQFFHTDSSEEMGRAACPGCINIYSLIVKHRGPFWFKRFLLSGNSRN